MKGKYRLNYKDQPFIICNDYTADLSYSFKPSNSILLYADSSGSISFGNQDYDFKESSVMLIPSGSEVRVTLTPRDTKCFFIYMILKEELLWHYQYQFDNKLNLSSLNNFQFIGKEFFIRNFQSLISYLSENVTVSDLILKNKFCEIIYLFNQLSNEPIVQPVGYSKNRSMWEELLINTLCIEDNNKSIKEIAKDFGISPATLKRHFKKDFDMPIKRWLTEKRLEKAKFLIESTDKTLKEISMDCGFCCPSYLIKLYKKKFGDTPKRTLRKSNYDHRLAA